MLSHRKQEDNLPKLSIKERLLLLRRNLKEFKIDAFLVPHNDIYFNEITAPFHNRLEWITGFTGSAGFAIIFKRSAIIFTDGRYNIQIRNEVNQSFFKIMDIAENAPFSWLKKNIKKNITIGFDPWLHSIKEVEEQKEALKNCIKLKAVDNLIDKVWLGRPREVFSDPFLRPSILSGENTKQKIKKIRDKLKLQEGQGFVLTCSDSICWLANIRGQDVPNSPLINCYALVYRNHICIYSMRDSYRDKVIELRKNVTLKHFDLYFSDIKKLKKVLFEPTSTPFVLKSRIIGQRIKLEKVCNPITLFKAMKNSTELMGSKKSHEKDGLALLRFIKWFKSTKIEELYEITLVKKFEEIRKFEPSFYYNSFDTISAAGSNAAITHYRASHKSNKRIKTSELVLVDSGGQYLEGTTDVTRTLIKGQAFKEQKFLYTKVLQGLICLSKLRWPAGMTGKELDPLARYFLWEHGIDYDHGTGHGVGVFSDVHQGPQGITRVNTVPLKPGMILSIEPGVYIEGKLGIRLENLVYVKRKSTHSRKKKVFLEFETLTLAPFEKKLIEKKLLSRDEIQWLNSYHRNVYQKLRPFLSGSEKTWLSKTCKAL